MSVRFWEGRWLLDLVMLRRDREAPVLKSQFSMIAVFLGVVSRTPENDFCSGVGVDIITTFESCSNSKVGVHY